MPVLEALSQALPSDVFTWYLNWLLLTVGGFLCAASIAGSIAHVPLLRTSLGLPASRKT